MKTIVVKNNDFETIGLEVTANGKTVFQWGISPLSGNWTKTIYVKDWYSEIFALVALQAERNEQRNFTRDFFETAMTNEGYNALENKAVNMSKHDEKCKRTEERMLNIIKNIK